MSTTTSSVSVSTPTAPAQVGKTTSNTAAEQDPMEQAVADFNEAFQYQMRLPLSVDDIRAAIELAKLRGRTDVSDALFMASQARSRKH